MTKKLEQQFRKNLNGDKGLVGEIRDFEEVKIQLEIARKNAKTHQQMNKELIVRSRFLFSGD